MCRSILALIFAVATALAAAARPGAADGAAIDAPGLISPADGMDLTDVATYFQWRPVPGCAEFEIQIALDPQFTQLHKVKRTLNRGYHKNLYFPKEVLPPGAYYWRVRAIRGAEEGPWSPAYSVKVNADHAVRPQPVRTIGPENPLFLMRSRTWDPLKYPGRVAEIIPPGLERVIVVDDLAMASGRVFERAAKYQELGLDFVIWNNRCQVSLATLEYVFQRFSHCLGTAEGEHFSGMYWERGPEGNLAECDFVHRAWTLCAKYGRFYFFADGDGGSYRWPAFAQREKETLQRYRRMIVPMFKTTNGDMALHSYGAVQGLMASGYVENCGTWVDEWIWPCCGFGGLGEILPEDRIWENRRRVGTRQCPWVYDIQMWLMGIASGSTVFHLESAHQWTPEGRPAPHYGRVFLPFVRAVVEHRLIPSRQAFLDNIRVAVAGDLELTQGKHQKQYTGAFAYLKDLYALKARGDREFLPNDSRYGLLCLLPPGAGCLNRSAQVLPQAALTAPGAAREIFDRAYPRCFAGEAFQWKCDGTVIVTNSDENEDTRQSFNVSLGRGLVQGLAGTVGVHQYIIGKTSEDEQAFWFQANAQDPQRDTEVVLSCGRRPQWQITPAGAAKEARWEESGRRLVLRLSHQQGAVEVAVRE